MRSSMPPLEDESKRNERHVRTLFMCLKFCFKPFNVHTTFASIRRQLLLRKPLHCSLWLLMLLKHL